VADAGPKTANSGITPVSRLGRWYARLRLPLLLAVVAYLAYQIVVGRDGLLDYRLSFRPWELVLAFATACLAYQMLFIAWLVLIRSAGFRIDAPLGAYARAWWASYLLRYVPGKLLLIVERVRAGKRLGLPAEASAVMPVIETVVAVASGTVIALLSVTYFVDAEAPLLLVALLMAGLVALIPAALRWLARLAPVRRRFPALADMNLGIGGVLLLCLPMIVHYLLLGLSFFLVARALVPMQWSDLPAFSGVYALSHVVSLLVVIAPAGLGVREAALSAQLQVTLPGAVSGVLALAARAWFTLVEVLCFLAVFALCRDRTDDTAPVATLDD